MQPGPQHELGTFSTRLSKCEFCVHGILEWGLCAQAWGLGIKEGPLWNLRGPFSEGALALPCAVYCLERALFGHPPRVLP